MMKPPDGVIRGTCPQGASCGDRGGDIIMLVAIAVMVTVLFGSIIFSLVASRWSVAKWNRNVDRWENFWRRR